MMRQFSNQQPEVFIFWMLNALITALGFMLVTLYIGWKYVPILFFKYIVHIEKKKVLMLPKLLVLAAIFCIAGDAWADDLSNLKGWLLSQPIGIGTRITLQGETQAITYIKGPSIGDMGYGAGNSESKAYVDFNGGGQFQQGEKPILCLLTMLHIRAIQGAFNNRLRSKSSTLMNHYKPFILPDIEIGPAINLPIPHQVWTIKHSIGVALAVKLG